MFFNSWLELLAFLMVLFWFIIPFIFGVIQGLKDTFK